MAPGPGVEYQKGVVEGTLQVAFTAVCEGEHEQRERFGHGR
jgi:hypothetical protein